MTLDDSDDSWYPLFMQIYVMVVAIWKNAVSQMVQLKFYASKIHSSSSSLIIGKPFHAWTKKFLTKGL